jgi:hypothetical protein
LNRQFRAVQFKVVWFTSSEPNHAIDIGTAITLLEPYELTGFLRICMTMIGTLPEFHDFILPLVS